MSRPLVMTSNILAWLLGVAIASGRGYTLDVNRIVLSFIISMMVSASIHYTNEYADFETDVSGTKAENSG